MQTSLDHEKLVVYQKTIELIVNIDKVLEGVPKRLAVYDQLDRASTSIPLNIAEGNGKYTSADRCKSFDIARGSALECAACLDVLVAKKCISKEAASLCKEQIVTIISMLIGLIKANSPDRLHEETAEYHTGSNGGSR